MTFLVIVQKPYDALYVFDLLSVLQEVAVAI